MIALTVAKAGFGPLATIEQTPVDLVLDAYEYLTFQNEYQDTAFELNKAEK